MPKLNNIDEFNKLKDRIDKTVAMRMRGCSYAVIGKELGVSPTMAYNYATKGAEILNSNTPVAKPVPETLERWQDAANQLWKLRQKGATPIQLDTMLNILAKEFRARAFKQFVLDYFDEKVKENDSLRQV